MRVFSRGELARQASLLSAHHFCQRPDVIAERLLDRLKPRETISTIAFSETRRVIRKPDGTRTRWDRNLTPYLVPIMAAHDDPAVMEIVVPKPARCGGTVVAENFALKCLDSGPNFDVMWYLAGPEEVRSYADRVLSPLFKDHEGVASRIGTSASDNKKTMKRVGSQSFELMVMSRKTTTNRQAGYIVFDEPDSYHRDFRSNFIEQGRQRQRNLGTDRKIYACAHPDLGWSGGIAAAWVLSSQGIFVMRCPQCGEHGSPYPTKYWAEVPRFRLAYEKAPEGTPVDQRLALAARTAVVACPNGCALDEAQRAAMVDEGAYMHKGQSLDLKAGILGEPDANGTWGFWIHVLMSKQVGLAELARELEGAIEHKERTGRSDKLKQVLVRTFGEAHEGDAGLAGIDAATLRRRTAALVAGGEAAVDFPMGVAPEGVLFVTAAIDPGHRKADVLIRGWDLQKRSWLIDRRTIRQRLHADGVWRDIDLVNVQDDWHVLDDVIDRLVPLQHRPDMALPVAVMMIDSGDGNITDRAYEYARRMAGRRWLAWQRVHCLKGQRRGPHLSPRPTFLSLDTQGRRMEPAVPLHIAGVDGLKDDLFGNDAGIGYLAIEDGSPGQIFFARDFPAAAYDELFHEPKIEGDYIRNGPNETIDLLNYTECGRLLLEPDRKNIVWHDEAQRPLWAKPVPLSSGEGAPTRPAGADAAPAKPAGFFDKHRRLHENGT